MVWEFVFMMLVLKIPIVYLCLVVYWAVRSEPRPPEPARLGVAAVSPEPKAPWQRTRDRRGPRRGPERAPARASRAALTR